MLSFDFAKLRAAYSCRVLRPTDVAREVLARVAARGDDGVWITRVEPDRLLAAAAALERRAAAEGIDGLPLFGLPFAVKDNIDVAGMPTTAACPGYAYTPSRSAAVVDRLLGAGALLVGKTNLDQFATGLVGVRSPYGIPRNPFDPAYSPGGSSSGSAVAVAAGLVAFAVGTDTAGSGRVPASFGNIVGLKPSRGLVSARGVVPACRSLDCVSLFALTVEDAAAALAAARGFDAEDCYSRTAPPGFAAIGPMPARFAFGVLRDEDREFFGDDDGAALYEASIARLCALGGSPLAVDFAPFREAASLVYGGAWLAERLAAIDAATGGRRDLLLPVTRQIIEQGGSVAAADVFRDRERLAAIVRRTAPLWREIDLLLVPTSGTIYRIAEVEAEPFALNERLGHYTNFVNLLDLAAIAVPNGFRRDGLPAGVSLIAPDLHDPLLAAIAARFQAAAGLPLGATGAAPPRTQPAGGAAFPYIAIAVVGAHLSGEPLNGDLVALGGRLRRAARTAPEYRLYALPDGTRPGLVRLPADGAAIEVEVWDLPTANVGALVDGIAPPLGLGRLHLEDGTEVCGFLCEAHAVTAARDITAFGGWRTWRQAGNRH